MVENFELTEYIGADTETTGLDTNTCYAFCLGLCNLKGQTLFLDFRNNPEAVDTARHILNNSQPVFHNAKFDIKMLENIDIKIYSQVHDSLTAAFLLNEYQTSFKLDSLATKYLKEPKWNSEHFEAWKKINKADIESHGYINVPKEILTPYTLSDATQALKLFILFKGGLEKTGLMSQYFFEMEFINLIKDVERNGLKIDVEYGINKLEEFSKKLVSYKSLFKDGYQLENPDSPKQVQECFIRNGVIISSTKKEVILTLVKNGNTFAKDLLVYRQLSKLVSGFINPILEATDPNTRRVKTNFNTAVTKTGRLSSSNPINFQNMPRPHEDEADVRNTIRSMIISENGNYLIGGDYDQEEMRIIADECKCEQLIQLFLDGTDDIYVQIAKLIWHIEEIDKQTRYVSKQSTLGTSFGMGAERFVRQAKQYGFDLDIEDAKEVIGIMRQRFPEINAKLNELKYKTKMQGYVTDRFGKRYHVPPDFAYKALNAVIQGTAAQVMKRGLIELQKNIASYGNKFLILSTVHDEVLCEVHESISQEESWSVIKSSMEKISERFRVPIKMSPKFFEGNWAHAKKV